MRHSFCCLRLESIKFFVNEAGTLVRGSGVVTLTLEMQAASITLLFFTPTTIPS